MRAPGSSSLGSPSCWAAFLEMSGRPRAVQLNMLDVADELEDLAVPVTSGNYLYPIFTARASRMSALGT